MGGNREIPGIRERIVHFGLGLEAEWSRTESIPGLAPSMSLHASRVSFANQRTGHRSVLTRFTTSWRYDASPVKTPNKAEKPVLQCKR